MPDPLQMSKPFSPSEGREIVQEATEYTEYQTVFKDLWEFLSKIGRCVSWNRVEILRVCSMYTRHCTGVPHLHTPGRAHAGPSACTRVCRGKCRRSPGGTRAAVPVLQALARDSWCPARRPLPHFQNKTPILLVTLPTRLMKIVWSE